jgi:hypothetical protein
MRSIALFVLALLFSSITAATELTDADAMELGYKIAAVNESLQNPEAPGALQAITDLGHDQRYYVMVRGWLMFQLQGDMSLLESTRQQGLDQVRARVDFILRAIRAIDLE